MMRGSLLLALLLVPSLAHAQWETGALFPTTPVAIGDEAHSSIAFGVRQHTTSTLRGPGQRGISSEALFNEQATVYVAGLHSMLQFVPGVYTIPNAYRIRATEEVPLNGVTLTNLYGLKIWDVIQGRRNWAIYTDAGTVSFGDNVIIRTGGLFVTSAPGYGAVSIQNGGLLRIYDGANREVGRLQGTADGLLLTVLEGVATVRGTVRIESLAGTGTRQVVVDADGTLRAR